MTAVVVALVQSGRIPTSATTSQIVRAVIALLSEKNLRDAPLRVLPSKDSQYSMQGGGEENDSAQDSEDDVMDEEGSMPEASDSEASGSDESDEESGSADEDSDSEEAEAKITKIASKLQKQHAPPVNPEVVRNLKASFPCLILCPTGVLNLASRVSEDTLVQLQVAARATHNLINAAKSSPILDGDAFRKAFLEDATPLLRFDRILTAPLAPAPAQLERAYWLPKGDKNLPPGEGWVPASKSKKGKKKGPASPEPLHVEGANGPFPPVKPPKYAGPHPASLDLQLGNQLCDAAWLDVYHSRVYNLLGRSLTDRVTSRAVGLVYQLSNHSDTSDGVGSKRSKADISPADLTTSKYHEPKFGVAKALVWEMHDSPPTPSGIWIGVTLDPTTSVRLVDRGPSPEDAEASEEFRAFWGPLAQLRRFQDGAIVEAVGKHLLASLHSVCFNFSLPIFSLECAS